MAARPVIHIHIKTQYLAEQSNPEKERYFFSYTINIANNGEETVQLLSRHWIITDGNNQIEEVKGEGVIGEQPYIAPGKDYEYTSGALLDTPVGSMEGEYQMLTEKGHAFNAPIPCFTLSIPNAIN